MLLHACVSVSKIVFGALGARLLETGPTFPPAARLVGSRVDGRVDTEGGDTEETVAILEADLGPLVPRD